MFINHTYKTSACQSFKKIEGNKVRVIYKLPYFPDRIAQWAIIQVIEKYILKTFISTTYSSIPKRGIHQAKEKIQRAMYNDPFGTLYCLKLDIKHFYQNVNHKILKQKYRKLFKDKELLLILDEIIDSVNTADLKDLIDFYQDNIDYQTGIPIGNYLSQYSGNLYLSDFDHWLKENRHIKYYYRYMDDIVILHNDKKFLHQLRKDIEEYLKVNLKLQIKDNWQIYPSNIRGIDFVGYRIFRKYSLLRKITCKTFKLKMIKMKNKVEKGKLLNHNEWSAWNSYNGWLSHCDSYHLKNKYSEPLRPHIELYYRKIIRGEQNASL